MFNLLGFIFGVLLLSVSILVQGCILGSCFGSNIDQDVNDVLPIKGEDLIVQYEELNRRLVGKTSSNDVQTNMEIVLASYNKHQLNKSPLKSKTLRAEKLFLSMRYLDSDKKTCSSTGKAILEENKSALQKSSRKAYYDDYEFYMGPRTPEERRIDGIYAHYLKNHATMCQQEYLKSFDTKLSSVDKERLQQVADICDDMVPEYSTGEVKTEVDRFFYFEKYDRGLSINIYGKLLELLDQKADHKYLNVHKDEASGKNYFDRGGFERLFNKNIIEPCKYFFDLFGPDVFEPALFVLDYLHRSDEDIVFFKNMARYGVCKTIIDNPDTMEEIVEMIVGPE